MLDKNAVIEQFIYTAGGTKSNGQDKGGAFDVWAQSKGLSKELVSEAHEIMRNCAIGDPKYYEEKIAPPYDRLKSDAKPLGIFERKGDVKQNAKDGKYYKSSDFERVEGQVTQKPTTILEESCTGKLAYASTGKDDDFKNGYVDHRNNPENAQYRIVAKELSDGRLLVSRITSVNTVYSTLDMRSGNNFEHALIFPAGTKASDINVAKLNFKIGLE